MSNAQHTANPFSFHGKVGELYGIWIINILLSMITLGIYSFWGKTRIRRYLHQSFSVAGDRFEYTGTGKELFIGFLKALPVLIIVYGAYFFLVSINEALGLAIFPLYMFLFYLAMYGSLRYMFSRTTWRGIRGLLKGSMVKYALKRFGYDILRIVSLGLLSPRLDNALYRYVIDNAQFGNAHFNFDGDKHQLTKVNIITMLLLIPTLGFSRVWYQAALARHQFGHTTIHGLRFHATHTGGSLLALYIVNLLILMFTVGLGMPFIIHRNQKYVADHVWLVGNMQNINVQQVMQQGSGLGDGIETAFDTGADMGGFGMM